MSRFLLLVAVLVALLSLTAALTPALVAEDSAELSLPSVAPGADCLNSCSSHGRCSNASTCVCDASYLGPDCSVAATMKPVCWLKGEVCATWAIQNASLFMRVTTSNSSHAAWCAVMWGATDGMSDGQSTILTVPGPYTAVAFEGYNTRKGRPTNTSSQSIAAANVTGFESAPGALDVSFVRALNTGLAEHAVLAAAAGTRVNMSVAYGQEFFMFHGPNATFFSIDLAATAGAKAEAAEEESGGLLASLWGRIAGRQ